MASYTSRLVDALKDCPECVFAEDVLRDGKVVKRFVPGTYDTVVPWYESLPQKHCYEVLLEDRPTRLFFDIEYECDSLVDTLNFLLESCLIVNPDQRFVVLSSCSAKKQSYHVMSSQWYTNVYHVGAWVRRLQMFLSQTLDRRAEKLLKALDVSVYTKNRMFRVLGSKKMGNDRSLHFLNDPVSFRDTLCQCKPDNVEVSDCFELDNSIPVSRRSNVWEIFECVNGKWVSKKNRMHSKHIHMSSSQLMRPIIDWLQSKDIQVSQCVFRPESMTYIINTRCRTCGIAKRVHRSNHIYYVVFPFKQSMIQKCFDEDCESRHDIADVDPSVWDVFARESSCIF